MLPSLTLLSVLPGDVLDAAICVGDTEEGWGACGVGRVIDGCTPNDGVACTPGEGLCEGDGEGKTAEVSRDRSRN